MVSRQMWAVPGNGSWGCGRCRGVAGINPGRGTWTQGLFCTSPIHHWTHSAIHEWRCFPWCVSEELFWWKARTRLSFYETGTKRNKFCSLSWHQSHQLLWQEIPTRELQPGFPHLIYCLFGTAQVWLLPKSNTKAVIPPQFLERATSAIHLSLFSLSYRQHNFKPLESMWWRFF